MKKGYRNFMVIVITSVLVLTFFTILGGLHSNMVQQQPQKECEAKWADVGSLERVDYKLTVISHQIISEITTSNMLVTVIGIVPDRRGYRVYIDAESLLLSIGDSQKTFRILN